MLLLDLIFFPNTQSPCNHNFVLLWDEFFVSCGVLLNLTDQIIRRYGWVYVAVVSYLPVICFGLLSKGLYLLFVDLTHLSYAMQRAFNVAVRLLIKVAAAFRKG